MNDTESVEVLQKLSGLYSSVDCYQDKGRVENFVSNRLRTTIEFETQFKRPNMIRFSWTGDQCNNTGYLVCDGKTITYKSLTEDFSKPFTLKVLNDTLPDASGHTAGAASRILAILMPSEIESPNLSDATAIETSKSNDFESVLMITPKITPIPHEVHIQIDTMTIRSVVTDFCLNPAGLQRVIDKRLGLDWRNWFTPSKQKKPAPVHTRTITNYYSVNLETEIAETLFCHQ